MIDEEEEDDADADGLNGLELGILIVSLLLLLGGVLAMTVGTGMSLDEVLQMTYVLLAIGGMLGIWFGLRYLFATFSRKVKNVIVEDLKK